MTRNRGLRAEVFEHGQDPAVIGPGGRQVKLGEDVRDVLTSAALMPSSVWVGGIRTSMTARSGWCPATALSSCSASGTAAATSKPPSVSILVSPSRSSTESSVFWSLLAMVILIAGFGILYSLVRETRPPHGAAAIASFDPAGVSLSGVQLAQIAVGVLGVLLITSEYASGLIRTTLAAVPRRLPVLWGKAVLVTAATVAASLPAAFVAFLAGQSILARAHLSVPLSQPGVARAVIGGALYLAVAALIGLGLGALRMRRGDV